MIVCKYMVGLIFKYRNSIIMTIFQEEQKTSVIFDLIRLKTLLLVLELYTILLCFI